MYSEIKKQILQKIKEYPLILIFRHFRPDGDAVGASKGLQEILRCSFPEKEIYLVNDDFTKYMEFLGPEDSPVSEDRFAEALGIVLDTASLKRSSNTNYKLCKELIKIDHHIDQTPYGDYSWVDPTRTSVSEMIVQFYDAFRDELKLNSKAATYLYTGIVTDSGRFRYAGVDGDTLRHAALLLDQGIRTEWIYTNLYLEDYSIFAYKAYVYRHIFLTPNGVAYLYVDKAIQKKYGLTPEDAGLAASYMETIKGCLAWIVFIETDTERKDIRVRMRSRFVPINQIAEKFRGGGHAHASGATIYTRAEKRALLKATDQLVQEYKATHDNWM